MGNVVFGVEPQQQGQPHWKRQQRPPFSSMSTPEILNILEAEFHKTLDVITYKKRTRSFDVDTKAYICQLMRDIEENVHAFNVEMVGKASFDVTEQMKKEIRKLKEKNDTLDAHNKKLEQMLTANLKDKSSSEKLGVRKEKPLFLVQLQKQNIPRRMEKFREEMQELQTKNASSQSFIIHLEEKIDKLERENKSVSDEKENLVMRLSKMVGQRLVENNPNIADLSYPNRPTRLGEVYSEIYDNEWTDAFEGLQEAGYDEEEAIITLRLTLVNALEFCKNKSEALLKKTEDAVNLLFEEFQDFEKQRAKSGSSGGRKPLKHLTIKRSQSEQWLKQARDASFDGLADEHIDLQERWMPKHGKKEGAQKSSTVMVKKPDIVSQLKVFRKEVAESMVPIVQKAFMSASWKEKEFISELYPFIRKCIFLGWMMVVQSPPMALATCEKGARFDKNEFKEYTATGQKVLFVVWPALKLHENGPVVGKGVAQGQKDR